MSRSMSLALFAVAAWCGFGLVAGDSDRGVGAKVGAAEGVHLTGAACYCQGINTEQACSANCGYKTINKFISGSFTIAKAEMCDHVRTCTAQLDVTSTNCGS